MKLLLNWFLNAVILYVSSEIGLLHVSDFKTAMILSLSAALITFIIRFFAGLLKVTGCLTLGITWVIGMILSIFAIPLSLYYAQKYVNGLELYGFLRTIIVSVLISLVNSWVLKGQNNS